MSEVFDVLYDSNLGTGTTKDVFEMASQLLQIEQRFFVWQNALPKTVSLVTVDDMFSGPKDFNIMRLRVIITSRYLHLRILTHRPLLCKYLEMIGKSNFDLQQF